MPGLGTDRPWLSSSPGAVWATRARAGDARLTSETAKSYLTCQVPQAVHGDFARHPARSVATTPFLQPMAQRYFMPSLPPPGPTTVTGDLAHHLGRVLRVVPGTPIVLGDGHGGTAAATVRTIGR